MNSTTNLYLVVKNNILVSHYGNPAMKNICYALRNKNIILIFQVSEANFNCSLNLVTEDYLQKINIPLYLQYLMLDGQKSSVNWHLTERLITFDHSVKGQHLSMIFDVQPLIIGAFLIILDYMYTVLRTYNKNGMKSVAGRQDIK